MRAKPFLIIAIIAFLPLRAYDHSLPKQPQLDQGALIDEPPSLEENSPEETTPPPATKRAKPSNIFKGWSDQPVEKWGDQSVEPSPETPPEVKVIPSETKPPAPPTIILVEPPPEEPLLPHIHFMRRIRFIPQAPDARDQPVVRDLKGQSRWDIFQSLKANTEHPQRGRPEEISFRPTEESLEDYEYAEPYYENPEQANQGFEEEYR